MQNFFYQYFWYFELAAIITMVYSLVIFAVMEGAVDHSRPKGEKLPVKKHGFVLRRLYRFNGGDRTSEPSYCFPKSICQLYRGLWWGTAGFLFSYAIMLFCLSIIGICGLFCGYLLRKDVFDLSSTWDKISHPRERYGQNDENKFVAPWKVILPAAVPILSYVYFGQIKQFVAAMGKAGSNILHSKELLYAGYGLGALVVVIIFILMIPEIYDFISATATWEYFRGKMKKLCKEVELV